jgi:hypothetical protein
MPKGLKYGGFIMNEIISILKVYNLVDSNRNKLRLYLGLENGHSDRKNPDKGLRWSFSGNKIPMPVRSGTWFNGFPEWTMLGWLKENGWYPESCVICNSFNVYTYEVPKANEAPKADDTDKFPALSELDKTVFEHVIRSLVSEGHKARACRIYRYAHGGKLTDALKAVEFIITE